jgi:hypothetical protein
LELLEVHRICLRNSAEFHIAPSPIDPLKALPGTCARWTVLFLRAPDEYIQRMPIVFIYKHRDGAAFNNIDAPSCEFETGTPEIMNRNGKPRSAVEPTLYGTFIVGGDPGYRAWLQGAHVRVDNFSGKFGLIVVAVKSVTDSSQDDQNEKYGRSCEPVPNARLRGSSSRRDLVESYANLAPQRCGGRLIELSEMQAIAQQIQIDQFSGTVHAMSQVTVEFCGPAVAQLTIEIALKERVGKITPHGQAP